MGANKKIACKLVIGVEKTSELCLYNSAINQRYLQRIGVFMNCDYIMQFGMELYG